MAEADAEKAKRRQVLKQAQMARPMVAALVE